MAKFNWTPEQVKHVEVPAMLVIFEELEWEAKETKKKMKSNKSSSMRKRR